MLFLWVPSPLLRKGMQAMQQWGFDYLTCAVWIKDKIGMGTYFRQQHELLLLGKRGTSIVPAPGNLCRQCCQRLGASTAKNHKEPTNSLNVCILNCPRLSCSRGMLVMVGRVGAIRCLLP
jgi:N6-adenosine-specific RNA methylase IME4